MAQHIKLFESWLSDIAQGLQKALTGTGSGAVEAGEDSAEFKTEFEREITDLSDTTTQKTIAPMKDDKYFVVHHTAGRGTAKDVVNILNDRGLGVQWVIDRQGEVFKTFPEGMTAWHAGHEDQREAPRDLQNNTAQGVEVIASNDADVLPVQVLAAFKLLKYLGYGKDEVWGHGEVTYNKETTEGATITNFWREHSDKSPEEAAKLLDLGTELSGQFNNFRA